MKKNLIYDDLSDYTVEEYKGTYLVVWQGLDTNANAAEKIEGCFQILDEAIEHAKKRQAEYNKDRRLVRFTWLNDQIKTRLADCDDEDKMEQILAIQKKSM